MNRHHHNNNNNNNNHEQRAEEAPADADDIGGDVDLEDDGDASNQDVDTDTDTDDDDNDIDDDSDDDGDDDDGDSSSEDEPIPTPEEVEIEYTYPQDFEGSRSWRDVVQGRFFRLFLDPSCTDIAAKKFQECARLIEIVVPKNSVLTHIRRDAFSTCRNLQRITNGLPTTLVLMEERVFDSCTGLRGRLVIPPNVTFLGSSCFYFCTGLTSVVFETSTSAGIEQTTVVLGFSCFLDCIELQSVRLPQTLITIPCSCFMGCVKLTDIPIPKSVQTLEGWVFSECKSLRSMDLSENVNELGAFLFKNGASLESLTIRSSSSNIQFGQDFLVWCPLLSTIKVYPWHFPKIFEAMKYVNNCSLTDAVESASFIYKFFHKYHHQILEDEAEVGVVTRQHRNGRRRRRISRNPQKRQRLQG